MDAQSAGQDEKSVDYRWLSQEAALERYWFALELVVDCLDKKRGSAGQVLNAGENRPQSQVSQRWSYL
jgi:hypothetical protein